ncbi:hypothetical protein CRG98_008374 [Punica granatum]|uniref:Uncharacterized protein n=1 Tax=Punica granatum TaxID=22663 RepID=A0A2I0KRV8_PUNGR|nr:hypothetical protein CRG98_008374 [Punica granatum]
MTNEAQKITRLDDLVAMIVPKYNWLVRGLDSFMAELAGSGMRRWVQLLGAEKTVHDGVLPQVWVGLDFASQSWTNLLARVGLDRPCKGPKKYLALMERMICTIDRVDNNCTGMAYGPQPYTPCGGPGLREPLPKARSLVDLD